LSSRPHRARKSLGQNFLVDRNLQRKIVQALNAAPDDQVLEIGPGLGALTEHLVGMVGHLTLVELDNDLASDWQSRLAGRSDVDVVHADILDVDLTDVTDEPDRLLVVGNIPYNITTPIVFHLLQRPRPKRIVLMVQKEVALRMAASAGRDFGALAVGVQAVADVRLLFGVPRGAFRPVPGVDSAVVEIVPHAPARLSVEEEVALRHLSRMLFQWRRKQLGKILRDHPETPFSHVQVDALAERLQLDLTRRPETMPIDLLLELAREFA